MSRAAVLAAALVVAALPSAGHAATPAACGRSWSDASGDATYGLMVPLPLNDPDLDIVSATVRVTRTDVVGVVTVAKLSAQGPTYGTGHGVVLSLTKYGKSMVFGARADATYGPKTYATGDTATRRTPVRLTVDEASSTFTLSVPRADIARVSGTGAGGTLTNIGVGTIRTDHVQGAAETSGTGGGGLGTGADSAFSAASTTVSLDACDAALRPRPKGAATRP